MPLVEEIQQQIDCNLLDMMDGDRAPRFMGRYNLSNNLVNALAHLVATDGQYSHLLRCDSGGHLGVHLLDYNGQDITDPASADPPWVKISGMGGEVLTKTDGDGDVALNVAGVALDNIATAVADVWDPVHHYLLVHQMT